MSRMRSGRLGRRDALAVNTDASMARSHAADSSAQVQVDPKLDYDAAKGEIRVPLLPCGPYLRADGITLRASVVIHADGVLLPRQGSCSKYSSRSA
jgi:hypothetical protein